MIVKTDMTAVVTSHELAIPAFLRNDYGAHFRREQQIASGSQGQVCMVHVYTGSELATRAKGAAVVGNRSGASLTKYQIRILSRTCWWPQIIFVSPCYSGKSYFCSTYI